ncbi:M3 family metallopeptidase [Paraferrimonas sp. SM1919]|uniref:M3 family metallopeptidase n=1 Tax=Paraferrimonas sp. SM1919 TaxID=2662263 RepID=UPI0013D5B21D|nr:M3 family metallopeptidase [Paraferrimonas sp. SM1919]
MLKKSLALSIALALSACSPQTPETQQIHAEQAHSGNPLLSKSPLQYQAPQFDIIEESHFKEAIEAGISQNLKEIATIANNPQAATFANTIEAMEASGELLERATNVFYNLTSSMSTEGIRALQAELAPKMSAFNDDIYLNKKLFDRVDSLLKQINDLNLTSEQARLLEITHQSFVRAGAQLTDEQKQVVRDLNKQIAELQNDFSQKLLGILNEEVVVVADAAALDGLSSGEIAAARELAEDTGHAGKYAIKLSNTTRHPMLTKLNNRNTREQLWTASAYRGTTGKYKTTDIIPKLTTLRAQKAELLGYNNWAEYRLQAASAKKPEAVLEMFASMVPAVVNNTKKELTAIQNSIEASGQSFTAQPWDWEYYAAKVKQQKYAFDEAELQQYFEFKSVLENGVFFTMEKLFGITFKARTDLPVYQPDVLAYEVFDQDGQSIALFYGDYFAREGKRGGAWMSAFVRQSAMKGTKPVIVNVLNIPKAAAGQPQLVSLDNVGTMFHEMGHALHGMFSDVYYPSLAGTAVARDVVEFPSTVQEDWALNPMILANYAKHHETGEVIPQELLNKALEANKFNQGFDTLEYMSAAMLDQQWHAFGAEMKVEDLQVAKFESAALKLHGVDVDVVPPRYKSAYFSHTFAGGYSASYYAYLWSEVFAADAFKHMQNNGGLTRENGDRFRKHILSVGNTIDMLETYKNFRGQEPTTQALLERRGIK